MKKILALLGYVILSAGCASLSTITSYYGYNLHPTSKMEDGNGKLVITELQKSAINFEFVNKGNSSAKIIWDESVLVDTDGNSHKIMHSGVRYMDAGAPMAPTTVPQGAKVSDMAMLTEGHRAIASTGDWISQEIIHCSSVGALCDHDSQIGKTLTLLLAVDIDGKRHEYSAKLLIKKAE